MEIITLLFFIGIVGIGIYITIMTTMFIIGVALAIFGGILQMFEDLYDALIKNVKPLKYITDKMTYIGTKISKKRSY